MNKSFTLIEILVVIVVIGILSAFVLVGMSSITSSANIAKSKAFSNSLRNSLLMNLISEWRLDGDTNDYWGVNHGTWNGGSPSWRTSSECVSEGCLAFDGVDDYISIGSIPNIDFSESFTIGSWVNLNEFGDSRSSCGNKRANIVRIGSNPSGVVEFGTITSNRFWVTIRTTINWIELNTVGQTNQWTYMVFINNNFSKTLKLFINGKETNQGSYNELISNTGIINIGGTTPNCSYGYINGLIDDVSIYSKAISSAQIQEKYYSGLNKMFKNNTMVLEEYIKRTGELRNSLANND